jgi:hypothetical protein
VQKLLGEATGGHVLPLLCYERNPETYDGSSVIAYRTVSKINLDGFSGNTVLLTDIVSHSKST